MSKPDWKDATCQANDCGRAAVAKGLCDTHYRRFRKTGNPNKTINSMHGMRRSPEYGVWCHIKSRCENQDDPSFEHYGGRGIRLCAEWQDFKQFLKDMGRRPYPKSQIDRIDNDDGYRPGNCRWTDAATNNQNRRSTKLSADKVQMIRESALPHASLAELLGVSAGHIARIRSGARWRNTAKETLERRP